MTVTSSLRAGVGIDRARKRENGYPATTFNLKDSKPQVPLALPANVSQSLFISLVDGWAGFGWGRRDLGDHLL
jgi:hypothetical protein